MAWWTNRIRGVNSSGWVVGLHWVNSSHWAEYGEAWMGKWCGGEYIHPGYHLFFAYIADHCTEKLMQAEDFQNLKINKKAFAGIFLWYFLVGENQQFWKSCLSALLSARLNRIEDWARGQSNQLLLQKSDFHIFPTEMIPVFSNWTTEENQGPVEN